MSSSLTLTKIFNWLKATAPDAELTSDSRSVRAGDVFVAYAGDEADGRSFISDAVERGAAAVVYEAADCNWRAEWNVPHLAVDNLKSLAGDVAAQFYGRPDSSMTTIAVTGTNGKTSCSQWLAHALSRLGEPTAVIGTLGVGVFRNGAAGNLSANGYTTPDAVLLQRTLAEMRKNGAKTLAIEASSIGLHQARMAGMHVDIALFTNFTRDHLDYHGDMAAYEEAKNILFDWPGLKHAIINLDDAMGLITGYTLTNNEFAGVDVLRAIDIHSTQNGTSFQFSCRLGSTHVKTQLVGQFNVSNVLAVIGAMLAKGIDWGKAVTAAEMLTAVPGRMQQLGGGEAPLVVIDYAHTPDALEKALTSLRDVATERGGELWCVFGCGGDRDAGKRPQMGKVATLADHIIVTSDNPRHEEPADIIAQIVGGIGETKNAPLVMEDRAKAILWAGKHAAKQDVILLAGKGHEAYQEVKGKKQAFLDADHAALALSARVMQGAL
jgi:UDP-N-acetylmuramoyl-L-alanyl-D-glutamate--2,6-diaminopimelate ligase